jgi:hypothetical protein
MAGHTLGKSWPTKAAGVGAEMWEDETVRADDSFAERTRSARTEAEMKLEESNAEPLDERVVTMVRDDNV